ncbi:MAG: hypothetical protein BGO27_08185 [Alphaproteobacteria bacterium 33-17]|nr:MAG: hypothetical protein BGO27_08185 [Alphaproteobacteria bacterium 33-17]
MNLEDLKSKLNSDKNAAAKNSNITPKQLKNNKIKLQAVVFFIICLLLLAISLASYNYASLSKDEKINRANSLRIQIMNAQQDMANLENRIREFEEIKKIWEKIKGTNIKRNGLDFDKARLVIAELNKSKFLPAPVNVNLSPPSMTVHDEKSSIGIETSVMDINFTAVSDVYALKVVDIFTEQLPGYIKYNNFKIVKIKELSNDIIDNLNKGFYPSMIELSMQVRWQNLKDINK